MFKKIILLFIVLFISSCFWEDEKLSTLIKVQTDKISILMPQNWEVLKNKNSIIPKINKWKIELIINSKNTINWFSNNLLILSDNLNTIISSKDYSVINNIWSESNYLNYNKINSEEIIFTSKEKSVIYEFEAKYNLHTPLLRFLQTAYVCEWNKAFFLTIALPITIKNTYKYKNLLSTFECR